MTMSTSEKKRKSDGRECKSPPPIPCTPMKLDVLLDKWIADRVFKSNQVQKEPTEEEQRNPSFCLLHKYVQHATAECWPLYRLVHCEIKEGTLELSQPKVQRNPLPNYKGKKGSISCHLRRLRRGWRRKAGFAYHNHYYLTEELPVQELVWPTGAHGKQTKDGYRGFGKHRLRSKKLELTELSYKTPMRLLVAMKTWRWDTQTTEDPSTSQPL